MPKQLLLVILSALIAYTGCSGAQQVKNDAGDFINVYVEQDGRIINFIDNAVNLKKSQFRFVFSFMQPDSLLLNASFNPDSFNLAAGGAGLELIPGFLNTGIAEEPFNPEHTMFISSDSPNHWFYYNDSDNRFDSVKKDETSFKCIRTITSVIDLDNNGEKKDITRVNQDTIYIVIVRIEWNGAYTKMIEKSRRFLKIKLIP